MSHAAPPLVHSLSSLKQSFGVRRTGLVEGDDVDAIMARIDAYTQADRLEEALLEVTNLPSAAQKILASWQETTQRRYRTLTLLAHLKTAL